MTEPCWRVRGQFLALHPVTNRDRQEIPGFFKMKLLTGETITELSTSTRTKQGEVTAIAKQLEELALQPGERVVVETGKPYAQVWTPVGGQPKAQLNISAYGISRDVVPPPPPAATNGKRTASVGAN